MKALGGLGIAILFTGALSAQYRTGQAGGFSSPGFSSGVPLTSPGATYQVGNAANPGGAGFRFVSPGFNRPVRRDKPAVVGVPYAVPVPVYVGGYGNSFGDPSGGDPSGGDPPAPAVQQQPQQQQPNVVVVYPQVPAPVMVNHYGPRNQTDSAPTADDPEPMSAYQPQSAQQDDPPEHYLIAFKDHTIYSAVAYWLDGDTLHYFTAGNKHNQVSLSLIDTALTERLNKDTGFDLKLSSPKQ